MKEYKVITINDGDTIILTNENYHYAEEFSWTEEVLTMYVNAGYEIIKIVSDYNPGSPERGGYYFYKGGFTVFLARDIHPDNKEITDEDWERINPSSNSGIENYVQKLAQAQIDEDKTIEEFDFSEDE